ncbi:MAG TPA: bL34 family ribosomal protein [Candidatus Tripitaka sp. YC43]
MSEGQNPPLTGLPIFNNLYCFWVLQKRVAGFSASAESATPNKKEGDLKVNIRRSSLKKRKQTSFLKRMRTKGGRNIMKRRRARGREI